MQQSALNLQLRRIHRGDIHFMPKINVENIDDSKKIQILKKAVEKEGLSYTAKKLGIDRSTLNRYINGKIQRIPNDIIEKAAELLTIEELSDIIYGFRIVEIDPTTALSVIIKAVRDEGFRNFFISLIWQYLGDYLKSASNTYIVTKDDIELFEKFVRENRAKKTADEHIQNIRRILADLNYELIPERIKEYMLDLQSENLNRARHYATTLKLFIKEIIKPKNSRVAKELYDSFKLPKRKFIYKPPPLSLDTLKKIFNNINDLGARALFLLLIETGLRVGEVLGLKVDQIDLEHRIIKIMKESETKRAYISFLHQSTARWVKEQYLPYREEFVRKYEDSIRKLAAANPEQGINIEEWKLKLFPFREDILRAEIKEAMKKVLGKEFRLYDLRSFFASYMIKQGASPMIVNLLQGRVPPQQFRILQDHYFVISDIELQQYYEKYAPKILE